MEQIIDNLNFAGLKERWNGLFPDYSMYEYLNDADYFDNKDDLVKDIIWISKDKIIGRESERKNSQKTEWFFFDKIWLIYSCKKA